MNEREWQFLSSRERSWRDASSLPLRYLVKSVAIKLRRRLWGQYVDRDQRLVWTPFALAEAEEPALVVRTYLEYAVLREILAGLPIRRACDLGCGYGRVMLVLQEFASYVKGFEREAHLVETARLLMPHLQFEQVSDLGLAEDSKAFDLAMTFTVLQHLTDVDARRVCARLKQLAPNGYVLCVEKTEEVGVSSQHTDGRRFVSRARPVATYEEYLHPFRLVTTSRRPVEPTLARPDAAGMFMLFAAPGLTPPRAERS